MPGPGDPDLPADASHPICVESMVAESGDEATALHYKQCIIDIVAEHDPLKTDWVAAMVAKYSGQEKTLHRKVCIKYGIGDPVKPMNV